jgi:hypothetical protein
VAPTAQGRVLKHEGFHRKAPGGRSLREPCRRRSPPPRS